MFLPIPTPGTVPEDAQRIPLRVNPASGVSVEGNFSTTQGVAGPDFSRVLAGKLESSPGDRSGAERSSSKEGSSGSAQDPEPQKVEARSLSSDTEGQLERRSGQGSEASAPQGEVNQWVRADGLPVGILLPWSGLDLVPGQTDPAGGLIPGPAWQGGLPLELRTRLAADIAARYTNRDGLQTLTVKLEPEHLGKLDIQLQARGNHLDVRLLAANRESEAALKENLKELTEAIQKQSGRFHQVDVRVDLKQNEDLADRSRGDQPGHSRDDGSRNDSRNESRQDPDHHDEPYRQDAEASAAGPDAPAQGG